MQIDFDFAFRMHEWRQLEEDVLFARARGYDTALEAYLDKDGLTPAVYNNLVETINANLPLLHRYVELRKKALGLDEVHLYDLYIPLAEGVAVIDVEGDDAGAHFGWQPSGDWELVFFDRTGGGGSTASPASSGRCSPR